MNVGAASDELFILKDALVQFPIGANTFDNQFVGRTHDNTPYNCATFES